MTMALAGTLLAGLAVRAHAQTRQVSAQDVTMKMQMLSQETGISVRNLKELQFAFAPTGMPIEELATTLGTFEQGLTGGGPPGSGMAASKWPAGFHLNDMQFRLQLLGITWESAPGQLRPVNDILLDLAGFFANLPDGPIKTKLAGQLFGYRGMTLIPILNQGREALKAQFAAADQVGTGTLAKVPGGSPEKPMEGQLMLVVIFVVGLALYFLPSVVGDKKANRWAIFTLNLLAGWTIVGWIIAMVWACSSEPSEKPVLNHATNPVMGQKAFCGYCGSPVTTPYCRNCGRRAAL